MVVSVMHKAYDLISRLNLSAKPLSKGQQKIADYINDHYDFAADMTTVNLAKCVNVSESTVVRFAVAMGYQGFPHFQKALSELVRHHLTASQRFRMSQNMSDLGLMTNVLKADMHNIRLTLEEVNTDIFLDAVQRIVASEAIYVIGLRSAAPLALFLSYYLSYIFDNVRLLSVGIADAFEEIIHIKKTDMLIGISFPRYSTRTVETMHLARKSGAQVIGITDGPLSPLHQASDICLQAKTITSTFVDSLAAPLSLLNALIVTLALHRKEALDSHFDMLETLWDARSVYLCEDKE